MRAAMKAAQVKNVVNLSSIGAHLPDGTGPITGLHRAEAFAECIPRHQCPAPAAGLFLL